jgi:hypothetical protein
MYTVTFQAITAASGKVILIWDVALCSRVSINGRLKVLSVSVIRPKAVNTSEVVLCGLAVSVPFIGPKVRGFKPGQGR